MLMIQNEDLSEFSSGTVLERIFLPERERAGIELTTVTLIVTRLYPCAKTALRTNLYLIYFRLLCLFRIVWEMQNLIKNIEYKKTG